MNNVRIGATVRAPRWRPAAPASPRSCPIDLDDDTPLESRGQRLPAASGSSAPMPITYYKRFRMEIDLEVDLMPCVEPLPPALLGRLGGGPARAARRGEVARVSRGDRLAHLPLPGRPPGLPAPDARDPPQTGFSPRRDLAGSRPGRLRRHDPGRRRPRPDRRDPERRRRPRIPGVGPRPGIVFKCLHGFREAGLRRVYLEVTAENASAVRLYRDVGFRRAKTLYKAVDG